MTTYIIFDSLSNLCKIGKTKNFKKRFSTLSTSNLNLECLMLIPLDLEKELHTLLKDKNISKEWFQLKENDLKDIQELYHDYLKKELE